MSRYVTKTYLRWEWLQENPIIQQSPLVPEHLETPTGVLNSQGEMIYKQPRPIGFMRDEEW